MKLKVLFPEDRTPEEIERDIKLLKKSRKIKSKGGLFCDNEFCLYHDTPTESEKYYINGKQFCSKECYESL